MQPNPSAETLIPELPSERKGIDDIAVIIFMLNLFGGYFLQVGLPFVLGRPFTADEDKPGGPLVAILTEPLWREHFGADLISSARISF